MKLTNAQERLIRMLGLGEFTEIRANLYQPAKAIAEMKLAEWYPGDRQKLTPAGRKWLEQNPEKGE